MTDKKRPREVQCAGKVRHDSKPSAMGHLRGLVRNGDVRERLSAYRCLWCGGWHVGHKPASRCNTPQKYRFPDRVAATLATARIARNHPTADAQEPYECAGHWHTRTVSKRVAREQQLRQETS